MKNLKRKISLLTARTVNLWMRSPEKIFYLHIPKCGGTSVTNAIQACYYKWSFSDTLNFFSLDGSASWKTTEILNNIELSSNIVNDKTVMNLREELLIYYMSQRHIEYIGGHFGFSLKAYQQFHHEYAFITILRNPVKRWISSYLYNRYRQPQKYRQINMNFQDYLESDFGKSQGYEYAKFLGGNDTGENFLNRAAIDRAKKNLHKFRLIGFLEDMDSFKVKFKEQFDRDLNIGFLNQGSKNGKSENPLITETEKEQIKKICWPDIEVYQYAVNNFASPNIRNQLLRV